LRAGCDALAHCPFILDAAEKAYRRELQTIRNERMKKALK